MTKDEMVEWHHQLNRHELEQTPGDSERQGSLECYSTWGHKESDTTEGLNCTEPRSTQRSAWHSVTTLRGEGWGGREAQDRGATCTLIDDSCRCATETNTTM